MRLWRVGLDQATVGLECGVGQATVGLTTVGLTTMGQATVVWRVGLAREIGSGDGGLKVLGLSRPAMGFRAWWGQAGVGVAVSRRGGA